MPEVFSAFAMGSRRHISLVLWAGIMALIWSLF
jgi:hypothetical protein